MNAVIAASPIQDFYFTPHRCAGLGLEAVRKILQTSGAAAAVLNFPGRSGKPKNHPLPAALAYLEPYLMRGEAGGFSFFRGDHHYGPSFTDCAEEILTLRPDALFLSCPAFCYADCTIRLAKEVRARKPDIPVIIGGAGPSAYPRYYLREGVVDFVLVGEAEACLPEFLDSFLRGRFRREIPNLYSKKDGLILEPPLRDYAEPEDMDFLWSESGRSRKAVNLSVHMSRGCPKGCRFCSSHLCHGTRFRTAPRPRIREGIREIADRYRSGGKKLRINFEDDNLLLEPGLFFETLRAMKDALEDAVFTMENGIDVSLLEPEWIGRMADLGVAQLNLSLVSTDREILQGQNRTNSIGRYESAVRAAADQKLPTVTYLICGFKEDTPQSILSGLLYLADQPTRIGFSPFYPVPNLPGWGDLPRFDRSPSLLCAGSSLYPWNGSLSTGQLVTVFRLCRFLNMLKKKSRTSLEQQVVEKSLKEKRLHTYLIDGTVTAVPLMDSELAAAFLRSI